MKKNLLLRLCLILTVSLSLYSCTNEDLYSSAENEKQEVVSKSLWKEDMVYINNVKEIFLENAKPQNFRNNHGGWPQWEYAMTFGQFDESYLMVPVVGENTVTAVVTVERIEDKVYFKFSEDKKAIAFFTHLVFPQGKKLSPVNAIAENAKLTCTTRTYKLCFTNNDGSEDCYPIDVVKCIETKSLNDNDMGGDNTGGDGYDYSGNGEGGSNNPTVQQDPCKKTKAKFEDPRIKNQFNALNTQANFDKDHEEAFLETTTKDNGSNVKSFTPVSGGACTNYVDLPDVKTGITGFGHTHNNYSCTGKENILAPSVEDLTVFLFTMVKQAGNFYGDYSQAYYFTVTSGGSYMFQYTGTTPPQNLSFDMVSLRKEYKTMFDDLKFKDTSMPQDKVEETFAKFLKEKVNIDGLGVYKVTPDSAEKLEYDPITKTMTKTPCP